MADLKTLAALAGIQSSYEDVWGNAHDVPEATIDAILSALGFAGDNEQDRPAPWAKAVAAQQTMRIAVRGALRWELVDEEGGRRQGDAVQEHIMLPPLPMGYYRLSVTLRDNTTMKIFLIVAPERCRMPDADARLWGVSAQLYGLRSEHNTGIGDYGDVATLCEQTAPMGVDVIGLSPLHAMVVHDLQQFSPYSPSSRLFLNIFYIDVTAVDGFAHSPEVQALWASEAFRSQLAQARDAALVDYALVAELKRQLFAPLFDWFQTHGDQRHFEEYRALQGEALQMQAVFDALCEHFAKPWQQWPVPYRQPDSVEVKQFAADHAARVTFYAWLQWVADRQVMKAQQIAIAGGMQLGLYRDLAVGSDKAGAEVWANQALFIPGMSVGAPPDEYNPLGQNWGLPAFNPLALQRQQFRSFIALVRANMRHAGALRIDHAFGLSRLFIIPDGKGASEGAYLHYPLEEMLAILKLESHRNNCVVIGEDLGTFPPGYKEAAAGAGVLSYRVFYFERDGKGGFLPPARYPQQALATLSTHDLPTLAGWWQGADLAERAQLNLYPTQALQQRDRENRDLDKPRLLAALSAEELLDADQFSLPELTQSVQCYLARGPAAMVMVQLEDVLGVIEQANLPATTTERPNWRMRLPMLLEDILAPESALRRLAVTMHEGRKHPLMQWPRATYRLQFHKEFTFYDAAAIAPYLTQLGISHVYASPYFKAHPGSMHGYDVVDHNQFNPELGGEAGWQVFTDALEANGLKQLLDFVPNHMGIGVDNAWWMSVLELGQQSPYAGYFDIDWQPRYEGEKPKLLLPVLGKHYGEALADGEVQVQFDAHTQRYGIGYFSQRFPLCPESCPRDVAEMEAINRDLHALHALLERQHYRLAFWRTAPTEINYRRFFNVNELAGVRVEDPQVFAAMHKLALSLVEQKKIHGLRIDHIDGLADPAAYCRALREKIGADVYFTVEKILEPDEPLHADWQIDGTSGYDALNDISGIFVDRQAEQAMDGIYRRFTGMTQPYAEMVHDAKCELLTESFASEWLNLGLLAKRIAGRDPYMRDYTLPALQAALKEIIAWLPVYRAYVSKCGAGKQDRQVIQEAVEKAKQRHPQPDNGIYDFLAVLLTLENGSDALALHFVRHFQQLSGPVMAKGVEDTVFYRFYRLVSLNEVGGNPGAFGLNVGRFHALNAQRAERWPHSMLATATHDTKRGEDMRLRIHALSEMPEAWDAWLTRWTAINSDWCSEVNSLPAPSANDEYLIYQTLLGSWPNELAAWPFAAEPLATYRERLCAYLTKAMREGKRNSNWTDPNTEYEAAVLRFVGGIMENRPFIESFLPAAQRLARIGALSSLGQLTLKLTLPGVPDIYQGTENWDLSLVDPDNRRPVDYAARSAQLFDAEPLAGLLEHWQDGKIKQQLMRRLLNHRRAFPDLYAYGDYLPLIAAGRHADQVIAFMRRYREQCLMVIVPVRVSAFLPDSNTALHLPVEAWDNTYITLPAEHVFYHVLTGERITGGKNIPLAECLAYYPLAVLATEIL